MRRPQFALRFSLLTLLIVMLLAGALAPFAWMKGKAWQEWQEQQAMEQQLQRYADRVALLQEIQKAQQELYVGPPKRTPELQARLKRTLEGERATEVNPADAAADRPKTAAPAP